MCLIWRLAVLTFGCCCCCLAIVFILFRARVFLCFGFVRFLKLNQPLKVLLHFSFYSLSFCSFLSFTHFFDFFWVVVWCYFISYFDKEIDNHSKADFIFLFRVDNCLPACCDPIQVGVVALVFQVGAQLKVSKVRCFDQLTSNRMPN